MIDFFIGLINSIINGLYQVTVAIGFPSYALAIILITIILKVLLYPLMAKQMKSMMNMQEVQPKLLALQKKYENNPEKLNQEMLKLYKEYDVNPMAGCLPLLIQMPILLGLYNALRQYQFEPAEHATFFWVSNLNAPDPYYILPILVGISMFLQQKASMGSNMDSMDSSQNQMMKTMLYIMPPMMAFVCISLPAGLCLYWAVFSLLGIGQQLIMNKQKEKQMAILEAKRAEEAAREAEEEAERKRKKKAAMMAKKKKEKKEAAEKECIEDAIIKEDVSDQNHQ